MRIQTLCLTAGFFATAFTQTTSIETDRPRTNTTFGVTAGGTLTLDEPRTAYISADHLVQLFWGSVESIGFVRANFTLAPNGTLFHGKLVCRADPYFSCNEVTDEDFSITPFMITDEGLLLYKNSLFYNCLASDVPAMKQVGVQFLLVPGVLDVVEADSCEEVVLRVVGCDGVGGGSGGEEESGSESSSTSSTATATATATASGIEATASSSTTSASASPSASNVKSGTGMRFGVDGVLTVWLEVLLTIAVM